MYNNIIYDISKRKSLKDMKVKDLIEELKKLPEDAKLTVGKSDNFFIHVGNKNNLVNLDQSNLEDDLDEYISDLVNEIISDIAEQISTEFDGETANRIMAKLSFSDEITKRIEKKNEKVMSILK